MSEELIKRAVWFLVLLLAQALVLGRIHLFNCATPLLYVYFVTSFPRNFPRWAILVWSFMLGLCVDIFFNTPGMASAAMTVIAVLQPYYFELFISRDSAANMVPSLASLGTVKYSYYIIVLVLLYSVIFFSLELFSFFNITYWAMSVVGSAALTLLLIFAFEIAKAK